MTEPRTSPRKFLGNGGSNIAVTGAITGRSKADSEFPAVQPAHFSDRNAAEAQPVPQAKPVSDSKSDEAKQAAEKAAFSTYLLRG